MGEGKGIARNVASNLGAYLVTVVAALVMSPFIVHSLGATAYGIWILIASISGYYGLLDFGIRSALLIQITQAWAAKDDAALNKSVNTALGLLLAIGAVAVIVTFTLAWNLLRWFDVPPELVESGRIAITVLGVGVALQVPIDVFQLVPGALQRFDITTSIAVGSRILVSIAIYLALTSGLGFVGIALAQTIVLTAASLVGVAITRRMLPQLRFGARYFDRAAVPALVRNATHLFLGRFSSQIIDWSDALIVGGVMHDPKAITRYAFANNLVPYYTAAVTTVGTSLGAYAVAWQAKGEGDKVRALLTEGIRWVGAFATIGAGGLFFVGPDFLRLWIGEEMLVGGGLPSSYEIMGVLCVAALGRASMVCVREVLIARDEASLLSKLGLAEAGSNIALSVILGHAYGLYGVAYGVLIPAVLVRFVWGPLVVLRRMKVPVTLYLRKLLRGPALILPVMGGATWAVKQALPIAGVVELLLLIALVGAAGAVAAYFGALTADERSLVRAKLQRARSTG